MELDKATIARFGGTLAGTLTKHPELGRDFLEFCRLSKLIQRAKLHPGSLSENEMKQLELRHFGKLKIVEITMVMLFDEMNCSSVQAPTAEGSTEMRMTDEEEDDPSMAERERILQIEDLPRLHQNAFPIFCVSCGDDMDICTCEALFERHKK